MRLIRRLCFACILVPMLMRGQSTLIYSYSVPAPSSTTGYAPNDNLLSYTDYVNGSWSIQYDSLSRLQSAAGATDPNAAPGTASLYNGLNLSWLYDSFGNRKYQTVSGGSQTTLVSTWTHYNNNNQADSNNVFPVVDDLKYDAAGNNTLDGANQYLYDSEGRICAAKSLNPVTFTQYFYDADGNRVAKATANSFTCSLGGSASTIPVATYILGPSNEQMTEFDGTGAWKHSNIFAGGQLLATYDTAGMHFPLSDPLGTVRVQVSAHGATEESFSSLPYGDGMVTTALLTSTSVQDATEHHFTGKERDSESGLDYFGARYYASTMGRFMSPDWGEYPNAVPYADLADPQSLNLYRYAANNPLRFRDADGHTHQECSKSSSSSTGSDGTIHVTVTEHCVDVPDWWNFLTNFMNWRQKQADAWNARIVAHQAPPPKPDDPDAALRAITDALTIGTGLPNVNAARLNRLNHVFNPKHNLELLVREYGSQEGAMQAIEKAAGDQLGSNISRDPQIIQVGQYNVTVTGGNSPMGPQVGNAWIPGPGQAGPP